MITARENILMAYHHEEPYWVPSQYLDQNTCVYTASQEGAHGYGVNQIDCFGVSWDFLPGMEGQMVTKGTKRIEDLSEWRDVLTMPDVEKWDWEGGAARDTAHTVTNDRPGNTFGQFAGRVSVLIAFADLADIGFCSNFQTITFFAGF